MRYYNSRKLVLRTFASICLVIGLRNDGLAQSSEQSKLVERLVRQWKSLDNAPTSKSVWTWHVGIPSRLFDAGDKGKIALLFLQPSQSPSSDLELADKKIRSLMALSDKGLRKLREPYVLHSIHWASKALDSLTKQQFDHWLKEFVKAQPGKGEARMLIELLSKK